MNMKIRALKAAIECMVEEAATEAHKTKSDTISSDSLAEDANTKEKDVLQDELDNFI